MYLVNEDWPSTVAQSQAMAATLLRGEPIPLASAVFAIVRMWQGSIEATGNDPFVYALPLDERLQSFLPLAYKSAELSDHRWTTIAPDDRLRLFLTALLVARTHPAGEISAALRVMIVRANAAQQKAARRGAPISPLRQLVIALGFIAVIAAGINYGWREITIVASATAAAFMFLP